MTVPAKSIYRHYKRSILNEQIIDIHAFGRFLTILENTSSIDIKISIASQPFEYLPKGISIELPETETFALLQFQNVSGATCTVTFAISVGRIYDNRVVISGELTVTDRSNSLETPAAIIPLPVNQLINNAAAVNKGGGKVGIPVTGQPFATGEVITIANTTNYDEVDHVVDATSSANEVVITYAYTAETFDGVNDSIGLTTPRSIVTDADQKEVIIQNNGSYDFWCGDANVDPANERGIKIIGGDSAVLTCSAAVYIMSVTGASIASYMRLKKL